MYANIADVKLLVGDTYSDEKIMSALNSTEYDVTSVVGDVDFGIKEEFVSSCNIINGRIYLKNIQVRKVLKVNDKDYSGSYNILPPQNRCVVFSNLLDYLDISNPDIFKIKYSAGYEEIPKDIIFAHAYLAASELTSNTGGSISKYKMGPRTVEYNSSGDIYGDKAAKILNRYRILNV